MKRILATFVCAALMGAAFSQTTTTQTTISPEVRIGPFMTANNLNWEDAATVFAISRMTGMSPELVLTTRGSLTSPWMDLAPAFMLATQSGRTFGDVMNMFNTGQTWLQIADTLGVPSIYWNPLGITTSGWTNADFQNAVWQSMLRTSLGLPEQDVLYLSNLGIPLSQQLVAVEIAREHQIPVRDVAATYAVNGNTWTVVQERFITVERTTQPVVEEQVTRTITTSSAPQPIIRTVVKEVKVPVYHTVVKKVPVYRTVSARPMRMAAKRRTSTRKRSAKHCVCTCPEHKKALAELARLKKRR
jgi:hypothetical protein